MVEIMKIKNILFPYNEFFILDRKMNDIQISRIKDYHLLLYVDSFNKYKYAGYLLFLPMVYVFTNKKMKGFCEKKMKYKIYMTRLIKIYLCTIIYINFMLKKFKIV